MCCRYIQLFVDVSRDIVKDRRKFETRSNSKEYMSSYAQWMNIDK